MERKRLIWADSLKGWLIALVVLGHAIQATMGDACETNHLWNAIYSFHMSAFMAVSGFLAFRPCEILRASSYKAMLARRFMQLMIPFLLWTVISVLINSSFSLVVFAKCILYPHKGFWFLWVLFFINVIFASGNWFSDKTKLIQEIVILVICVSLAGIMVIFDPRIFGFQFIAYYFIFYSLGFLLHKFNDKIVSCRIYVVVPLAVCWCGLSWFWQMHELPYWLKGFPFPDTLMQYAYRIVTAAVAIYLLLALSPRLLNEEKINKPFVELGRISLGIYTAHMIMVGKLARFFLGNALSVPMTIICSFLISLFVSWLIVWLLGKWKVTAKYLLGKI